MDNNNGCFVVVFGRPLDIAGAMTAQAETDMPNIFSTEFCRLWEGDSPDTRMAGAVPKLNNRDWCAIWGSVTVHNQEWIKYTDWVGGLFFFEIPYAPGFSYPPALLPNYDADHLDLMGNSGFSCSVR